MPKGYWLICNTCGYSKEVYSKEEIMDNDKCPLCQGKLVWDMNAGKKLKDEPTGDNIPIFDKEKQGKELERLEKNITKISDIKLQEQEVKNSINMIGNNSTWEMVEAIGDVKLRIRYRMLFFKCGGKIPEKENI